MDAPWIAIASAAAGAAASALVCRWQHRRAVAELRRVLAKSEQQRQAAQQRGDQARVQIGQLSKALADFQRSHRLSDEARRRRAEIDKLVPSESTAVASAPTLPASGFADTLPMVGRT